MSTTPGVVTKTGQDRTIPLHPEAEADLLAIMRLRPTETAALAEWEALPIFTRRLRGKDTAEPMDRNSYRNAWKAALSAATKKHPELAGMVARDFRETFRTALTDARVLEPTIRRLMGHSVDVSQGYYELTDEAAEDAIMRLSLDAESKNNVNQHREPQAAC